MKFSVLCDYNREVLGACSRLLGRTSPDGVKYVGIKSVEFSNDCTGEAHEQRYAVLCEAPFRDALRHWATYGKTAPHQIGW